MRACEVIRAEVLEPRFLQAFEKVATRSGEESEVFLFVAPPSNPFFADMSDRAALSSLKVDPPKHTIC